MGSGDHYIAVLYSGAVSDADDPALLGDFYSILGKVWGVPV